MIVAKTFTEVTVEKPVRDLVFGTLVVEDVVAILMIATLSAVASGMGLSGSFLALSFLKLVGFLVMLITLGLFLVPRFLNLVIGSGRQETSLIATVGLCFGGALLFLDI